MAQEAEHLSRPAHEVRLPGQPLGRGIAFGFAHVDAVLPSGDEHALLSPTQVETEVNRLHESILQVRRHLADHVRHFHAPTDEDLDQIVAGHQLILDDKQFIRGIVERIRRARVFAERAVEEAFCAAADRLAATRDAYLRSKAEDIRDVCQAVRTALIRGEAALGPIKHASGDAIFVVNHLHVSSVLRAQRSGAIAFVSTSRAFASHAALLLRASTIPSVAGVEIPAGFVRDGTPLFVDAERGEVILNPAKETRRSLMRARRAAAKSVSAREPEPAITPDGVAVQLWANIDTPEQMHQCVDAGLFGVGLFRTEFMVLQRGQSPSEEEQFNLYRSVVSALHDRPLVIRTFDIGAEKVVAGLEGESGANPALGVRGLRRHLQKHPDELHTQLRAILRATLDSDATVLLPMVTEAHDVVALRTHLDHVCEELDAAEVNYNRDLKVAAMIEVPAAALHIDEILDEVDRVAIGTNDLTQYLAAADRNNAEVASYLTPDTSGLFTLLGWLAEHVRAKDRLPDVFVCGEVPSNPEYAIELAALGFTRLVVTPRAADEVRHALTAPRRNER